MKAVVLAPGGQVSGYLAALSEGLGRHGVETQLVGSQHHAPPPSDDAFAVCWGWRKGAALLARGYDVLVVERGYLGDRREWTSLAWNGLNGRGDFCLEDGVPALDAARRDLIGGHLKPWRPRKKGKNDIILVMEQVHGDQSLQGRDLRGWYHDMARQARKVHKLPVFLRPHPVAVQKHRRFPCGLAETRGTLPEDLAKAWAVIAFNSNSTTDAVMAGVPAMTADTGAMAWGVTAHDIESLGHRPRRERVASWAQRVSWCQWRIDELSSGDWFLRMRTGATRRLHQNANRAESHGTDSHRAAAG